MSIKCEKTYSSFFRTFIRLLFYFRFVKFLWTLALIHVCHGQEINLSYLPPITTDPSSPLDPLPNCPVPSQEPVTKLIPTYTIRTTEKVTVYPTTTHVTITTTTISTSTEWLPNLVTDCITQKDEYLVVTPVYTNTLIIKKSKIPDQFVTSYSAVIKPQFTQIDSEEIISRRTTVYDKQFHTSVTVMPHNTRVIQRSYTVEHKRETVQQPLKTTVEFTTITRRDPTIIELPRQTVTRLHTIVKDVTQTEYVVPPAHTELKTWTSLKVSTTHMKESTMGTSTVTNIMSQFSVTTLAEIMTPTIYIKTTSTATHLFQTKATRYLETQTEITRSKFKRTVSLKYVPTALQSTTKYDVIDSHKTVPGIPLRTVDLEEVIQNSNVIYSHVVSSIRETTLVSTDVACQKVPKYNYGEPALRRQYYKK